MNSISTQLRAAQAPSAAPPRPAAAPQSAEPKETLGSTTAPPPWAQKPSVDIARAQKPTAGQKQGISAGKVAALGVGLLAAGVGIGAGVMGSSTAAEAKGAQQVQTQQTREERKASENLSFLNQIGKQEGGGLKIDGTSVVDRFFGTQREATPQQALNALKGGGNVYFFESQGDAPVTISSYDQLSSTTRDLRERIAQTKIEQGVENIKDGLKQVGKNIGDIFRD